MNNIADQCLKEASHFPNNRVGAVLKEAVKEMSRLEAIVIADSNRIRDLEASLRDIGGAWLCNCGLVVRSGYACIGCGRDPPPTELEPK